MVQVDSEPTWAEAGISLKQGTRVNITAGGSIQTSENGILLAVSPQGYAAAKSPGVPAAGTPTYALLGKFGTDGKPFVVGKSWHGTAPAGKPLFLVVNSPSGQKDAGHFLVAIETGKEGPVVDDKPRVLLNGIKRPPVNPDARVLWIYIDSARPDVIRSMAAEGSLPNISRYFLRGGTEFERAIVPMPSETLTSNASLRTGVSPARHGVKGPVAFDRQSRKFASRLDRFGPPDTADDIRPHSPGAMTASALGLRPRGGPLAVYDYLNWGRYASSAVPIHSSGPDSFWLYYIVNRAPVLRMDQTKYILDEADVFWGCEDGLTSKARLVEVWLPELDTASHGAVRGQFDTGRAILSKADFLIGRLFERLRQLGQLENTYVFLFSDHGFSGGDRFVPRRYDLGGEFFFSEPRSGDMEGLGLNVAQYDRELRRPGVYFDRCVYVNAVMEGFAEIYLPQANYATGAVQKRNSLGNLLHYETPAGAVDLVHRLLNAKPADCSALDSDQDAYPVNILAIPIENGSVLLATRDRGWACIRRKENEQGVLYQYTPVEYEFAADGKLILKRSAERKDPLGYYGTRAEPLMGLWLEGRLWLEATSDLEYPDAVAALADYTSFEKRLEGFFAKTAPDLILLAGKNWYYDHHPLNGAAHGHLEKSDMFCTLCLTGPGIARGAVVAAPVRLYDVLPTTLDLIGVKHKPGDMDAKSLFTDRQETLGQIPAEKPTELPGALPYTRRPSFQSTRIYAHDEENPLDLHNIFDNAVSVSNQSVGRLANAAAEPKRSPATRQATRRVIWSQEDAPATKDSNGKELVRALRLEKWDVSDTVMALSGGGITMGNIMRVGRVIDWFQDRAADADKGLSAPLRAKTVLGAPIVNPVVDGAQEVVWGALNIAVHYALRFVDEGVIDTIEHATEAGANLQNRRRISASMPATKPAEGSKGD